MAWNLGSRLSGLERAQNHIQSSMSSLKEDTHSIKNMMSEMYEVSKGLSYSNKEELIKKAKEEAIILAISKLKVIKVVQEEAEKIGLNPKKIPSAKAGIKSSLPAYAPAPEQASSKSSRRKRKHMELEPETEIPRFECNRAFLENVLFVNNIVIEEPEHMIFFTDEFDDQAFQR
nr:copia protein [Tanacetum cinerariifolium]